MGSVPGSESESESDRSVRWVSAAVVGVAAIVAVTCSSGQVTPEPVAAPTAPPPLPPPAASSAAPIPPPSASVALEASVPAPDPGPGFALPRFFSALQELEAKKRGEHVRILWLGDSHTQADFWTHAVRRSLQRRFGNGGPGFVFLGLRTYRHSGFHLSVDGAWNRQPSAPSHVRRQDDGVFGLGGMRTIARPTARIRLTLREGAGEGSIRWEVAYRLGDASDAFSVAATGAEKSIIRVEPSSTDGGTGIQHVRRVTDASGALVVAGHSGTPEIFGAVAETSTAGVVVDTLGINGARIGTPVAWDDRSWIREAERRRPALVVFAYGTNEAGDATALERYPPRFEQMLGRARAAAGGPVDCLLVGPTDRAGTQWNTLKRVGQIDDQQRDVAQKLGCEYFSAFEAMGGDGGFKEWRDENPPLAHTDRVHLTPQGYKKLGLDVAERMLSGYDAWKASR